MGFRTPGEGKMASVHKLFARACEHHKASRLNEAEALRRQVGALDRKHFDGLYLLGLLFYQFDRYTRAVEAAYRTLWSRR